MLVRRTHYESGWVGKERAERERTAGSIYDKGEVRRGGSTETARRVVDNEALWPQ